jgi:cytochrome P450
MAPTEFDPFTRQTGEIPYAEMARLRRLHRVVATPSFPYLTRYEDCRRVLVDNATFANVGGMRAPGVVVAQEELMINEMDPPQHTRIRKLEQTTLNQAGFKQARSFIDELARRLVGEIPRSTVVDLVPALTAPVPGMVAAHIIGVPVEDFLRFRAWSEEVLRSSWVELNRTERGEGLKGGYPEFAKYLDEIVTARRANPQDDLITRMVETEVDGQRLTDTEMRIAIAHLIIAGNETTTNLLGNLFFRLFESEALYARIRNDRSLIPSRGLRVSCDPVILGARANVARRRVVGANVQIMRMRSPRWTC